LALFQAFIQEVFFAFAMLFANKLRPVNEKMAF